MAQSAFKYSHIVAGLSAMVIGGFAVFEAWDYPMGSVTRMGPGYFPFLLGFLLFFLGLMVVLLEGRLADGPDIPYPSWRGLVWVPLAVCAFALLVETAGLAPAIIAAVIFCSFADDNLSMWETAVLAIATAAVCTVIFIYVLGLPLDPVWMG